MRGEQPWRTNRSAVLRSRATGSEARLWAQLRNRQLGGFKFIRQAPIGAYFVDFVCRERKIVIEVDGATHGTPAEVENDAARTAALERMGYRVVRVTNDEILHNIAGVLDTLLAGLEAEA